MRTDLLKEIDAFLAETEFGDFRFGLLAAGNGRLMERLRRGGRVWPETEQKIRDYIQQERSRQHEEAAA